MGEVRTRAMPSCTSTCWACWSRTSAPTTAGCGCRSASRSTRRPASCTAVPSPACSTRSWCRSSDRHTAAMLASRRSTCTCSSCRRCSRGRGRRGLDREARAQHRVLRERGGRRDVGQGHRPQRADLQRQPGPRRPLDRRAETALRRSPSMATVGAMVVDGTAHGITLSESASKALLRTYGVPMADEREVDTAAEAAAAAAAIGFPVVAKLCGDAIAHKTERGLVRLRLHDADVGRARRRRTARRGDAGRRPGQRPGRADGRGQPRADRRRGARSAVRRQRDVGRRRHPGRGDRRCRLPARSDQSRSMPTR